MADIDWQRQTSDKPLFPDVLWNRPETKRHAGKLLIVGGNQHGFVAPAEAFRAAEKAGAGTVRLLLPDSLRKFVGPGFTGGELAPTTPSGSFSRQSLAMFLDLASWADGVLLAGDISNNSETAVLLEAFVDKYSGQLCLTGDSLDYFMQNPTLITKRERTLVAGDLAQIQKLAQPNVAIKQTADLAQILDKLSIFSTDIKAHIVTTAADKIIVASSGKLSTTPAKNDRVGPELAAYASVWWMQQPEQPFASLTTAVYSYNL